MKFNFRESAGGYKWEEYLQTGPEFNIIYGWCVTTFGRPGPTSGWDSHGGWLKFLTDKELVMFLMRWS